MIHAKLTQFALPLSLAGLLLVAGCNKNESPQNAEQPAASRDGKRAERLETHHLGESVKAVAGLDFGWDSQYGAERWLRKSRWCEASNV